MKHTDRTPRLNHEDRKDREDHEDRKDQADRKKFEEVERLVRLKLEGRSARLGEGHKDTLASVNFGNKCQTCKFPF